ncbi:MAG: FHA domain-containing protein [Dysgonamonadaceae bacterium]|jgi:uncharacterized protein YbaR (Trm112 family)|nr:FHA domain-containing protein [Dysgonamonadaceae bacterium]
MISIRCPHCHVGLKVDEKKIPAHIETFSCPNCKEPIAVSVVTQKLHAGDAETIILQLPTDSPEVGRLRVIQNQFTMPQIIHLSEGVNVIGRKSSTTDNPTAIETGDKLMSRNHIVIEIKKDQKGQYKHYLSDNKSKNRTLYNSNYIESGEIVVLKNKDEIQIGQTRVIFEE